MAQSPFGELLPELSKEIKADERIPNDEYAITVESLPVFKEYQERYDELYPERIYR